MPGPDNCVTSPPGPLLPAGAQPDRRLLGPELAEALATTLGEARLLGFLGPGPVVGQVHRALAFTALTDQAPDLAVDLGTGGGVPGLVLATIWPTSRWLLVDSNQRRCRWLEAAVRDLDLGHRCDVVCERAEVVARGASRHEADLVTARSFGPPAPTAECAAPLLRLGGQLLVADPPEIDTGRWPPSGLAILGLALDTSIQVGTPAGPASLSRLVSVATCPEAYPRRVGLPFKRPLF
jgi:16S rRNA (guanine527-N7)-methyltransferase